MGPYTREKIDNWVGDFCASDALRELPIAVQEFAPEVLTAFLVGACEARGVEPDEIEEADAKAGLLERAARLALPPSARSAIPALCAAFLVDLQQQGRLGGGRVLGAYVRAMQSAFDEAATGKAKPVVRPGSRIGRNDPCPCGSGKKYKKCCQRGA
ncbi:MAG: SEC-C metal-binding domain-containing protein [Phycisphaerae bacterium]